MEDKLIPSNPAETGIEKPTKRAYRLMPWVVFLLFLFVIGLSAAFCKVWHDTQQLALALRGQSVHVQQLNQRLAITRAQQNMLAVGLKNELNQWLQANQHQQDFWEFAQINYYIDLANSYLTVRHDASAALPWLILAQQTARTLQATHHVASISLLIESLQQNIALLGTFNNTNAADALAQLNALTQQIVQLPLKGDTPPTAFNPAQGDQPSLTKPRSWWQLGLQSITATLRSLVVLQTQTAPFIASLTPQQQQFLLENIKLQLGLASWAVMNQENALYQQSLRNAAALIQQYAQTNAPITQSVLHSITLLQSMDWQPPLPSLDKTRLLMRNILSSRLN